MLRKNNFWEQMFDDPFIEKENYIRRKMLKTYNLMEDDFASLAEYNDYLEHIEVLIHKLVNSDDVAAVEEEVKIFREQNLDAIERNRRRLNPDDQWIKGILDEEAKNNSQNYFDVATDHYEDANNKPRSIISELRDSDLPAEMILDRERKVQIEAELAEKEERERRKRERTVRATREVQSFGPVRQSGKPYHHTPFVLAYNGPLMPSVDELSNFGYLNHIRQPGADALAAGFRAELSCYRALFESRWDLFLV